MAKKVAQFWTKKVCLIVLAAVVALGGVIWAIVANAQPKFRSRITDVPAAEYVSGNGTASVMVDDYLYFVGDSIATSAIKYGDNEYYADGKIPDSGIFRVKIENGQPVLDYKYDNTSTNDAGEKFELQAGDEGYNTKVVGVNDWENIGDKGNGIEAVVPKIAGHEKSALWVFGEYLIYVSPHNRYDNRGNLLSDYLDFFRVDLDGKNHTLIYTSESNNLTKDNFTVWANAADNIYLLVYETAENEIKKINVCNKKVTTLDSDVSNVVLPSASQYRTKNHPNETLDKVYGGVMDSVYYTKAHEDNALGNQLYRCPVDSGEPALLADNGNQEKGTTFTPLAVTPLQNGNAQFVFSAVVKDKNSNTIKLPCLYAITNQTRDDYRYSEPASGDNDWGLTEAQVVKIYANGFYTVDNQLWHYEINGNDLVNRTNLNQVVDAVLAVIDNTMYLKSGSSVNKITPNGTAIPVSIGGSNATESADATESDDSTTDNSITLPMAVLYQPYRDTGDHMIFVQDATNIRLCNVNNKVHYLKFK